MKNFNELRARMSPERLQANEEAAKKTLNELSFDWRKAFQDQVRDAFPGLHEGEHRRMLILPIARAKTAGEASVAFLVATSAVRAKHTLTEQNDRDLAAIAGSLAKMASMESEI